MHHAQIDSGQQATDRTLELYGGIDVFDMWAHSVLRTVRHQQRRWRDDFQHLRWPAIRYPLISYDHRVVDGADAARFLVTLKERLEGGAFESDLGL